MLFIDCHFYQWSQHVAKQFCMKSIKTALICRIKDIYLEYSQGLGCFQYSCGYRFFSKVYGCKSTAYLIMFPGPHMISFFLTRSYVQLESFRMPPSFITYQPLRLSWHADDCCVVKAGQDVGFLPPFLSCREHSVIIQRGYIVCESRQTGINICSLNRLIKLFHEFVLLVSSPRIAVLFTFAKLKILSEGRLHVEETN